jgi:hypothetical protein
LAEAVADLSVVVPAAWSCAATVAVAAGEVPAEPLAFVVASAVPSAASCPVAMAGCCAAVAVGSALPELPDAAVVAAAVFAVAPLAVEPVDATGALVVVVVAMVASAAAATPVWGAAADLSGVCFPVAWVDASVSVVAAVVVAVPAIVAAVASAAIVPACSGDDPSAAVADWLAAMAAAAIASGAVPLPDAGDPVAGAPVAGVAVTATSTGTATASGLGVVGVLVPSCVVAVEPAESVAEVSPDDEVALEFVEPSFELVDLLRERGGASAVLAAGAAALLAS